MAFEEIVKIVGNCYDVDVFKLYEAYDDKLFKWCKVGVCVYYN